jgi:PKD repeat protein
MKVIRVVSVAILCLTAVTFTMPGDTLAAGRESDAASAGAGGEWCRTQQIYDARYPDHRKSGGAICPPEGPCDDPATRDANIPGPGDPPITLRIKFNIFAEDDGSNPAGSLADAEAQVEQLNSDYAPYGFHFVYDAEIINDSQYRSWADNEEWGMKSTYADEPDKQCNIYVVYVEGSYSFGTFPWDPVATDFLGGIVLTEPAFGPHQKTLTHEMGHNLGLWHTHHGVSEVNDCSACWELADKSNGDVAGDFCSDTDPTPVNYACGPPGGGDTCSGTYVPWGSTDPQNYMGYAGDYCWTEFSQQQAGRIHCWFEQELTGWIALGFAATPREGAEALNVNFTYETPIETSAWKWYFGDGDTSLVENPSHLYGPGLFDVTLVVTTPFGDLYSVEQNFITVWADTFDVPESEAKANEAGYVEIWGTNAVPIEELILPISITNVTSVVFFDSVSFVGTRLDYFENIEQVYNLQYNGKLCYRARADAGGGSPPLPPGSGPMARVHYRVRNFASPGDTAYIGTEPMGSYSVETQTVTTQFAPIFNGGTLHVVPSCVCANQGDTEPDGFITSVDLAACIDILFAGSPDVQDIDCPTPRFDLDCDGFTTSLDLTVIISYLFESGPGPCDPCVE